MNRSEEAFLFSTFKEFCKCWRSGTRARVIMESMNGNTFVNFSAFLGHPDNAHFQPRPSKRNPTTVPRKKSEKKIKRDNDRAARFQEQKKNKQGAAASASKPVDNPEASATSTPGSESVMTISSLESSLESQKFTFASPVQETLRQSTSQESSMILSDKKEQQDEAVGSNFHNFSHENQEEEFISDEPEQQQNDNIDVKKKEEELTPGPVNYGHPFGPIVPRSNQDKKEQRKDDRPTHFSTPFKPFKPLHQPKQLNFAQQIPQHGAPNRFVSGGELANVLDNLMIRLQNKEITEELVKAEANQLLQFYNT